MRRNIVPLMEVGEYSDSVRLADINLPGVPVDELLIDLTKTEKAMHWGGIRILTLGSYEGEISTYVPNGGDMSMNSDGSITSSASKLASKVRLADPESEDLEKDADYRWRNTAIYFNSGEIRQTLSKEDPEDQVKKLDKSLRSAMLLEITANELNTTNLVKEVGQAALYAAIGQVLFAPISDNGYVEGFVTFCMPKYWLPGLQRLFRNRDQRQQGHELPPKYSTMFQFKFDRAALATRHLVGSQMLSLPKE